MTIFETMLIYIILFILLAVPGFALGKRQLICHDAITSLSNILMYIAMPFLVFSEILKIDLHTLSLEGLLCSILFPVVITLVLAKVCERVFGRQSVGRGCCFCAVFSNCGFLGIPLAVSVFADNPAVAVYTAIFNVVNSFMIWTLGVRILSEHQGRVNIGKALLNPVSAAIVLGVLLSALHIPEKFCYLSQYSEMLAALTTPLSMTVLGYELSQSAIGAIFTDRHVYSVSLIKLLVSPILAMLILLILKCSIGLSDSAIAPAMFISTAVSTAATASAMAESYGADSASVARMTLGTTLLCVVTLPLIYLLFKFCF